MKMNYKSSLTKNTK